jgi:hypothetical protein
MLQDTGKFRTNGKDQFYTQEAVAKTCIDRVLGLLPYVSEYLWVEPSAGNGSFLNQLPFQKIGLDIDPKSDSIVKQDYLTWVPPSQACIVFGNPPFGKQSSLAKAFISKSCGFANVIAFILPKSFTKPSMYKAFHMNFHLVHSEELAKDSFVLNGLPYDVPCIFQVWQKKDIDRPLEEKILPMGFQYVKEDFHIALRRVGGNAGKCDKPGKVFNVQCHYFIRFDSDLYLDRMIEKINHHIFPSNTVGPRSLSKAEVNVVLNEIILSTQPLALAQPLASVQPLASDHSVQPLALGPEATKPTEA